MADVIPERDLDLVEWIDNFLVYTTVNPTTVGLTVADINTITEARDLFRGSLTDLNASRSAYESAITAKRTARVTTEKQVRQVIRKVQNSAPLTDATRAALQVTIPDTVRSVSVPLPPTRLIVMGSPTGTHRLDWDRAGNAVGAQFVVEARIGVSTEWTQVDVVTATKYLHKNQKPGVPAVYRVRARRRSQMSEPSNEAALYL